MAKSLTTKVLGYGSLLALTISAIFGGWKMFEQTNNVWVLRGGVVILAGFLVEKILNLNRKK